MCWRQRRRDLFVDLGNCSHHSVHRILFPGPRGDQGMQTVPKTVRESWNMALVVWLGPRACHSCACRHSTNFFPNIDGFRACQNSELPRWAAGNGVVGRRARALSQFYQGANSLRTADLQQCIWGFLGSTLCCRHSCGTLRDHWFGVLYDGRLHGKVWLDAQRIVMLAISEWNGTRIHRLNDIFDLLWALKRDLWLLFYGVCTWLNSLQRFADGGNIVAWKHICRSIKPTILQTLWKMLLMFHPRLLHKVQSLPSLSLPFSQTLAHVKESFSGCYSAWFGSRWQAFVQVLSQLHDTHSVIEFPLFLVPMLLFGVPATCIQIFNAYPFPQGLGRVPAALILTYGPSSCVVFFICMTCFACTGQPWYWPPMAYSAYCLPLLGFCSSIVCRALARAQAHAAWPLFPAKVRLTARSASSTTATCQCLDWKSCLQLMVIHVSRPCRLCLKMGTLHLDWFPFCCTLFIDHKWTLFFLTLAFITSKG